MNRPEVRVINNQTVESEREVTGWEAEEILRKYGYTEQNTTASTQNNQHTSSTLTFEEMIKMEDDRIKNINNRKNAPKPITFESDNYETTTKWGSDDETGFGFKIEISTDMKLPKY